MTITVCLAFYIARWGFMKRPPWLNTRSTAVLVQVDAAYSSPFRADSRMSDNCPGSAVNHETPYQRRAGGDDDVNTVHFKVNSCSLKARNVQVQVQVRVLNHRVQVQVQVRQKPDSSPTRVQVQDSSPTTLPPGEAHSTPCNRWHLAPSIRYFYHLLEIFIFFRNPIKSAQPLHIGLFVFCPSYAIRDV